MVISLLILSVALNVWLAFKLMDIETESRGQKKSLQLIVERKEAEIVKLNGKINTLLNPRKDVEV
jgi:hypothetical protein